jgi:hypothetical protein
LVIFGCGPEAVSAIDHPLLGGGFSHLLLVFKKNVRAIDRSKPKDSGADFQWRDQLPSVSADPNGFGPTPIGNEIEREAHRFLD